MSDFTFFTGLPPLWPIGRTDRTHESASSKLERCAACRSRAGRRGSRASGDPAQLSTRGMRCSNRLPAKRSFARLRKIKSPSVRDAYCRQVPRLANREVAQEILGGVGRRAESSPGRGTRSAAFGEMSHRSAPETETGTRTARETAADTSRGDAPIPPGSPPRT